MAASTQKATNLFQVYLRLRPPQGGAATGERFLTVEEPDDDSKTPKHITLNPPNDRRRAIEKFAFTQVFEEDATQLDVFNCVGVANLINGVLAPCGGDGTDALVATLGVTGSGKSHTILGSRSQRGLTQLALDVIFQSLGENIVDCDTCPTLEQSIVASDPSEAAIFSAPTFLDSVFVDLSASHRPGSRAQTPMNVGYPPSSPQPRPQQEVQHGPSGRIPGLGCETVRVVMGKDSIATLSPLATTTTTDKSQSISDNRRGLGAAFVPHNRQTGHAFCGPRRQQVQRAKGARGRMQPSGRATASTSCVRLKSGTNQAAHSQGESIGPGHTPSRRLHRPSTFPQQPDVNGLSVSCDPSAEYAVLISMYEVYNDRIFDLLTPPTKSTATKEYRRRPLLFKPTEASPDRKVVAGLRKVICGNLHQALMVLEAGLHERRVAGTGSNSVSSRSHGFFCVEVKKRTRGNRKHGAEPSWGGSALTIVDLAGSERARDAKTAGTTLAEAGKINESLMYLGQCLQMQSDAATKDKPNLVPFRQCKLTELLFSNCYPSPSAISSGRYRNPQKAVMIVTADPHGDYNATSQILRYSALAREVTVPRIPSITQTILAAAAQQQQQASQSLSSPVEAPTQARPSSPRGRGRGSGSGSGSVHYPPLLSSPDIVRGASSPAHSPANTAGSNDNSMHRSTVEAAVLEISRLTEEIEYLQQALEAERTARQEAEARLLSMEDRMVDLEQAVREDCTNEFERRLEIEMARWRAMMQVEMERGEEHWGRKIELFERSFGGGGGGGGVLLRNDGNHNDGDDYYDGDAGGEEGDEDKENILVEDVHQENERLRRENEALRREIASMSPTKRLPLRERVSDAGAVARGGKPETGSPRHARTSRAVGGGGGSYDEEGSLLDRLERLRVNDAQASARSSAGGGKSRKVRKLPGKRWNAVGDDDDLF
ncbi:hypothetical protein MYCTH_2309747 [Thermothelomyces thermophilus ATCC 42464]|uniref:Kinesin motor domain-containing protein n=1 Tax=Thermothelomyces thermophilus (strain ATCC 42464 / BCRC 31852 / DSM 1799) TaxID=573729 RepID=G2QKM7_THET4|nr:uncharacterized protein MYCTH_2309747 [Thermothelomyces thermophilus ATCC 42464]AEO60509.1 hypothetical protein MYCTH_2309747 [Thermothelomyces thermophilus ATCC 42464]